MANSLAVKLLLAISFLIPLAFTPQTFDHFGTPKIIIFLNCTVLLLVLLVFNRQQVISKTPPSLRLAIILFLLAQFVQSLRNQPSLAGLLGAYGQSESFSVQLGLIILSIAAACFLNQPNHLKSLTSVITITSFITSIYGIFQYFNSDPLNPAMSTRVRSLFGDPNSFGIYLVMSLPLIFWRFETEQQPFRRNLIKIVIFLAMVCLTLSFSRAAWLSLIISLIVFIGGKIYKNTTIHRGRLGLFLIGGVTALFLCYAGLSWAGLLIGLGLALWLFFSPNRSNLLENILIILVLGVVAAQLLTTFPPLRHQDYNLRTRIDSVTQGDDSGRILIWSTAWEVFKTAPIFGHGLGSFQDSFHIHQPIAAVNHWGPERDIRQVHNEYLHYLATQGIIGLIAYLLLLSIIFKYSVSTGPLANFHNKVALWSGVAAYLIFMLFAYPLVHYSYLFWIYLGILLQDKIKFTPDTAVPFRFWNNTRKGILLVLAGAICFFSFQFLSADLLYQKAYFQAERRHYRQSLTYFKGAISKAPWVYHYRYRYLVTIIRAVKWEVKNNAKLIPAADLRKAALIADQLSRQYPRRYMPLFLNGQLAESQGQFQSALSFYQRALQLFPANYKIYYRIAYTSRSLGKESTAQQAFAAGLRLNREYMIETAVKDGLTGFTP